mmetsp:Transcript_20701/g.34152  ORF Transcript_20701/g.34152 Transcript_20701/m.34152 type:complete len:416 (-) Transcript_20701:1667-2914(-)|eukprot:CAMPEP_0203746856 /NCGR_PEP_ID=MMETSP0098-20131031/2176_1 /ASSEMBLY_ACC=CAM_ASM_000208 /TAXON_ID=96639 /ORGANISM=" , Strain NY0313808BC1" /LENGTH=415 /DNA_ID=CAMNT_0050635107 /DNA_START=799 /DNA_END=2046 /DNA_ORIENTATION=-
MGDSVVHEYSPGYVVLSFVFSLIGSYAAVHVVETFRRETVFKMRCTLILLFSVLVGGVGIWQMHFVGMYAVSLKDPETNVYYKQEFNLGITIASYFCAVLFVFCGALIASTDKFFGTSMDGAILLLGDLVSLEQMLGSKYRVRFIALFGGLGRIALGGCVAGSGVVVMHFVGMAAEIQSEFYIEWDYLIVAMSILLALVVATAGFWIVFRFLQWKPGHELARLAAAVVIASAVTSMHYVGNLAASYHMTKDGVPYSGVAWGKDNLLFVSVFFSLGVVLFSNFFLLIYTRKKQRALRDGVVGSILFTLHKAQKDANSYNELQDNIKAQIFDKFKENMTLFTKSAVLPGSMFSTEKDHSFTSKVTTDGNDFNGSSFQRRNSEDRNDDKTTENTDVALIITDSVEEKHLPRSSDVDCV